MTEGPYLPVIEAREILERIEQGEPVIYDHVAIAGDIDLSRLDLPFVHNERSRDMSALTHVIASHIEIRNSDLLGRVNFVNSLFREPLDLSGSTFRQEASYFAIANFGKALLYGLAWVSCVYGVRPRYTVFWSCFFILVSLGRTMIR